MNDFDDSIECTRCGRQALGADNGICEDCQIDEQFNAQEEASPADTSTDLTELDELLTGDKPQHSTYAKIAGGKYNVLNKTLNRMTITNSKDEAKRTARKWDSELGLSPKGNKASTKSKRKRLVDTDGNELPTKTELIQEGVRRGMPWRDIATYARCRYQMAYNIGSRYAKANPQLVDSEKVAVIYMEDES